MMPGRLLTMQRQLRELGRLRTGYTDISGPRPRPVKSQTWIVTSHAEHYVESAAEAWGGTPEKWQPAGNGAPQFRVITDAVSVDALLPSGDPLSQTLELWSGGGCVRRCDGVTDIQSDSPCICRAQHGDNFHEQAKGTVCAATTRLNVFLPDMPDVGVWRAETHSHYAAQEIAGAVDLIKAAAGTEAVIPIRLRIEQRQRKAQGQTKKFPVIVVELRGGITTGQLLMGVDVRELSATGQLPAQRSEIAAPDRRALPAAPTPAPLPEPTLDVDSVRAALTTIAAGGTLQDLRDIWKQILAAGLESEGLKAAEEMRQAAKPAQPAEDSPADDPDTLWLQILQAVPVDWTSTRTENEFRQHAGVLAEDAGAAEMRAYLEHLAAS